MKVLLIIAVLALPAATAVRLWLAGGRDRLDQTTPVRDPGDDVADMRGYGSDPGPYEREADDPGEVIAEPPAGLRIHPDRDPL